MPLNYQVGLLDLHTVWDDFSRNYSFFSNHPGGAQFAMCDGSVTWVANEIDLNLYRAWRRSRRAKWLARRDRSGFSRHDQPLLLMTRLWNCGFGLAWFATLGCNPASGPQIVPAGGVVLFKGQAFVRGPDIFSPASGRPARGVSNAQGRFRLSTLKPGDGA